MVGALGHLVSSGPPKWLEIVVTHVGGQLPLKILDSKAWVSFPSQSRCMHIVTRWCQENKASHKPTGRDQLEAVHLELSRTLPNALLPLADFKWYLFPLTNC